MTYAVRTAVLAGAYEKGRGDRAVEPEGSGQVTFAIDRLTVVQL